MKNGNKSMLKNSGSQSGLSTQGSSGHFQGLHEFKAIFMFISGTLFYLRFVGIYTDGAKVMWVNSVGTKL